jgi:hypothetical protein
MTTVSNQPSHFINYIFENLFMFIYQDLISDCYTSASVKLQCEYTYLLMCGVNIVLYTVVLYM